MASLPMKEYFQLQFRLLNRNIREAGLHPLIVYFVLPPLFFILSYFLFEKITLAVYVYGLIALGIASTFSEAKRNDFLKTIFKRPQYLKLRVLENLIVVSPFIAFMLYSQYPLQAIVLISLVSSLATFNFKNAWSFVIPTPFGKKPFEFVVGFRKTFIFFPLLYFLSYAAVRASNFSLGAFSLVTVAFVCFSYYSVTEAAYFVWIHQEKPQAFLWLKIRNALLNFFLLASPIILVLSIFFSEHVLIIAALLLVCMLYLVTIIFAKYAAFPKQINFIQGLIIGLCIIFPPTLLAVMPYFYKKSVKQLNTVLA